MVKMAKTKKLKSYKFQGAQAPSESWEALDEFTADEDIVILGFTHSMIGRGVNGATGITKSGTVDPSIIRQDDVLHYQECAGVGGNTNALLSHATIWFPEDVRPELDKGNKIYLWGESAQTNIYHVLMYYYEK